MCVSDIYALVRHIHVCGKRKERVCEKRRPIERVCVKRERVCVERESVWKARECVKRECV